MTLHTSVADDDGRSIAAVAERWGVTRLRHAIEQVVELDVAPPDPVLPPAVRLDVVDDLRGADRRRLGALRLRATTGDG